jgi:hypothetical protein
VTPAGYPRFYRALREAVRGALLEVSTCRSVARKGINLLGGDAGVLGPTMAGQWALLGEDNESGYAFDYLAGSEFEFPFGADPFQAKRYGDTRAFGEGRLVLNVISAGEAGSSLSVVITDGSFLGGAPSCPLDEEGIHESDWTPIILPASPDPPDSALLTWVVENPNLGTFEGVVGTAQFQVR